MARGWWLFRRGVWGSGSLGVTEGLAFKAYTWKKDELPSGHSIGFLLIPSRHLGLPEPSPEKGRLQSGEQLSLGTTVSEVFQVSKGWGRAEFPACPVRRAESRVRHDVPRAVGPPCGGPEQDQPPPLGPRCRALRVQEDGAQSKTNKNNQQLRKEGSLCFSFLCITSVAIEGLICSPK